MPITLGCPSCGKRFRARDESAGKRVKCPYCASPVSVPTAEEAATAGAPTSVLPTPAESAESPAAAPAHSGAAPAAPPPPPAPLPDRKAAMPARPAPKPPRPAKSPTLRSPEEAAAAGWRKTRGGLFWVLFGLLFLTIPGFVGFGKIVYQRSAGQMPAGEGWVKIPGYVNDNTPNAIQMSKPEQLDVVLYAAPVLLGGLCLTFGRLTCGAAPRSSGAGGLFACSGLFTLLGLASLLTSATCDRLLFRETYTYTGLGFLVLGGLAEFWFLIGLTASGLALKRPSVARAVSLVGFLFALAAAIPTLGWMLYTSQGWRPRPPNEDWILYEQAGIMLGWLLIIGAYWRAVRGVRAAIRDHLSGA